MKKLLYLIFGLLLFQNSLAQKGKYVEVEMITHAVQMGETIRTISLKYLVEPGEIYQFNKYAVNGIKAGMVLQIPVPVRDPVAVVEKKVKPKKVESQQVDDVVESKPIAAVKPSQTTKPVSIAKQVTVTDTSKLTDYVVEAKETLYSLSKKFNISVDELKWNNPTVEAAGLQVGMVLKIPSTRVLKDNESTIGTGKAPSLVVKPKIETTNSITHKVEPKETLYSLSKKYSISVEEIQKQNEAVLVGGLQIGLVLTIKK